MKIQNLDLWSNLYLAESKYNVAVKPVNLARVLWPVFLLVVIFVFVFSAYWPFVVLVIEVFVIISYLIWYWLNERWLAGGQTKSLILHPNGEVSLNGCDGYQLHSNSRVGWLGCWLIYKAKSELNQANTSQRRLHRFYAKQQFSAQDYARLSRFILRNRTLN